MIPNVSNVLLCDCERYVLADSQMYLTSTVKQRKLAASYPFCIAVAIAAGILEEIDPRSHAQKTWQDKRIGCQRHIIRVTERKSRRGKKVRGNRPWRSFTMTLMIPKKRGMNTERSIGLERISSGRQNCSVTVVVPIFFLLLIHYVYNEFIRHFPTASQRHLSLNCLTNNIVWDQVLVFNLNNVVI